VLNSGILEEINGAEPKKVCTYLPRTANGHQPKGESFIQMPMKGREKEKGHQTRRKTETLLN